MIKEEIGFSALKCLHFADFNGILVQHDSAEIGSKSMEYAFRPELDLRAYIDSVSIK